MIKEIRSSWVYLLGLILAATYYCHRVFGVHLPLEGDAAFQLYFRIHEDLARQDYNPHQWYYTGYLPFVGVSNPVLQLVSFAIHQLAPHWSRFAHGLATAVATSWLLLWLLSWSVYFLLRYLERSRPAAALGAIVFSYTGFHLMGVREFNHMFLVSLVFVAPTLICFYEVCRQPRKIRWAAAGGLLLGASYLGGANAPMFYFFPFVFLFPLLVHGLGRPREWLRSLVWQFLAAVTSLFVGAPVIFPGIVFLSGLNRPHGRFTASGFSPWDKFVTLFLRDWWRTTGWSFHETDCFVGLPVLILFTVGLWSLKAPRGERASRTAWNPFMLILLAGSVIVSLFAFLPTWLATPIGWFYHRLSISNADRFFELGLLPIAYFAAVAFDSLSVRRLSWVSALMIPALALVTATELLPAMDFVLPEMRIAALLSLGCAVIATVLLFGKAASGNNSGARALSFTGVLSIYLMYALAPIQSTLYPWNGMYRHFMPKDATERTRLSNILGLTQRYERNASRLAPQYFETHPSLSEPWTLNGRVLVASDLDSLLVRRSFFHAPVSGHEFAFTQVNDPATPRRIAELASIASDTILDIYGVCSVVPFAKDGPPLPLPAVNRPSCLPKAYLVPKLLPLNNDAEALTAMKLLPREQFLSHVVVNCGEFRCDDALRGQANLSTWKPQLKTLWQKGAQHQYEIDSQEAGLLFLSIPFRFDWKARINGKPAQVLRANHAFMAIPFGAGKSNVELSLGTEVKTLALWFQLISVGLLGGALLGPLLFRPRPERLSQIHPTNVPA